MKKSASSISVVFFAFSANLLIAVVKFITAMLTRSSAMLAEAVHSAADTLNQVLLLVGIHKGRKRADDLHPFGFAGELYFWSFIVAIMLFTLGAFFSIYKGIHKLMEPEVLLNLHYAIGVLVVAMIAEGIAFLKALRKVNRERHHRPLIQYLRNSKKSALIVVFLEDLAALVGLSVALLAIIIQRFAGWLWLDGLASIIIGCILAVVALFLGFETKSLLIGESADPEIIRGVSRILRSEEEVFSLFHIKSLQLGPEDILLAIKAEFNPRLTVREISTLINGIEKDIRRRFPAVKKIFIEPDIIERSRV